MGSVSIPLKSNKYPGHFAVVDEADYERVRPYVWSLAKRDHTCYATATINDKRVYLHRVIMAAPDGKLVDHRNGNGLICTRENLRLATPRDNVGNMRLPRHNTSGYKGAHREKNGTWSAVISIGDFPHHLGFFNTAEDAARAYDAAAIRHFGEFALTNFADSTADSAPPRRVPRVANSGHRGVSWNKRRQLWRAYVCRGNKLIDAGYFPTIEEAVAARERLLRDLRTTHSSPGCRQTRKNLCS